MLYITHAYFALYFFWLYVYFLLFSFLLAYRYWFCQINSTSVLGKHCSDQFFTLKQKCNDIRLKKTSHYYCYYYYY